MRSGRCLPSRPTTVTGIPRFKRSALDAADADGTHVARIIEQRHLQLQRSRLIHVRGRTVIDDGLEERLHVAVAHRRLETREAAQRRGVDHGEIELLIRGTQTIEQIEGLIEHPVRDAPRRDRSC